MLFMIIILFSFPFSSVSAKFTASINQNTASYIVYQTVKLSTCRESSHFNNNSYTLQFPTCPAYQNISHISHIYLVKDRTEVMNDVDLSY